MKLKCPACKCVVIRDMRTKMNKGFMTKRGYRSYCETKGKDVFLKGGVNEP